MNKIANQVTQFNVSDWQHSEQSSGYWLINLTLTTSMTFDVASDFWLDSHSESLRLFHQTAHTDRTQLQLLSRNPIIPVYSEISVATTQPPTALLLHCRAPKIPTQVPLTGNLLILGSGVELANLFCIAKQRELVQGMRQEKATQTQDHSKDQIKGQTLALLHSSNGFPFVVKPARFLFPELPAEAIGASSLLEDWKINNRLASELDLPGCFEGSLAELLEHWIYAHKQTAAAQKNWQVIACLSPEMTAECRAVCETTNWLHFAHLTYHS